MGLSTNVWQFFIARAVMGMFAGFSTSAIALVASQAPERRLGYALGWLSTGQMVGSLVGPVLGGILADATGSYRIPFYITSVACFSGLGLVWFVVQENFVPPKVRLQSPVPCSRAWGLVFGSASLMAIVLRIIHGTIQRAAHVQPMVTLFVQELVGSPPQIATLAGIAFSITGLAKPDCRTIPRKSQRRTSAIAASC